MKGETRSQTYRFASIVAASAVALVAALSVEIVVPERAYALSPDQIDCRDQVAKIARRAANTVLQTRIKCARNKLLGVIPLGIDCTLDSGTGDLDTDRRLAKFLASSARAAKVLDKHCESTDPLLDIDPADLLPAGSTCAGAATWALAGPCIAGLGKTAADSLFSVFNVSPPGPVADVSQFRCLGETARQTRKALGSLNQTRAKCYRLDDALADGGGVLDCDANIAPPGTFSTTGSAGIDRRLEVPAERVLLFALKSCDVDLPSVGFNFSNLDERSGGDFATRLTTDDLVDNVLDALIGSVATLTAEIFPVGNYCGDGVAGGIAEECDDGNFIGGDGCNRDCSTPRCGNGSMEGPGAIEECDDGNTADGDGCNSTCTINRCGDGILNLGWDEICDAGGESASCDDDCTPQQCGDEEVNMTAGEECDEGLANDSSAPDTCGDGLGSPPLRGACENPFCGDVVTDTGEECDDGGETNSCDLNCTVATCGDGDLNMTRGEECDDGNMNDNDSCPDGNILGLPEGRCLDAICGDGFACTDPATCTTGVGGLPEQCDGDGAGTGGESPTCDTDCSPAICGDGQLNGQNVTAPAHSGGETCDDGNLISGDGCDGNCTVTACGNEVVTTGEGCDDGDLVDETNGCDSDCTPTGCGNGIVTTGEDCDGDGAGNGGETLTCDSDCMTAGCGNLTVNATAGEECDPGGGIGTPTDTATCDDDCTFAFCGDGDVNAANGEACDDGGETAACNDDCSLSVCGDSVVNTTDGEECDDGGESASCDADCSFAVCGDLVVNNSAGEDCDPGGETAACNANCTASVCGDSIVNTADGEECDDGNVVSFDGCDSSCQDE